MRRIAMNILVVGALVAGLPLAPSAVRAATGVSCTPTFAAVAPAATTGGFHSFGPVRLADTRSQLVNAGAGCTLAVDVPAAIPSAATAVVLSVTADRTAAAGFLTVHPCGSPRPDVSNVNVRAAIPNANVVVTALDTTRQICVYTSVATDLIVDITGYLGPNGAAFQEVPLHRSVDTRFTSMRPDGGSGPIGPGAIVIPHAALGVSDDASAVIVNVTATQTSANGYLTAYPCAPSAPDTSNVNFAAKEDRANQAIVGLAADGSLCVFASVATHVIVDVSGEFAGTEGLPFASSVGVRLADSRNRTGGWTGPLTAGETRVLDTSDRFLPGTRSVVVNVLATRATAPGFLTVFPCGSTPTTSSVNFGPGRDVANLVVTSTGVVDGKICVFSSAPTDVVIDLFGGFIARGLRTLTFGPGTPAVTPAFQPDIHDYAARCTTGSNTFAVDALGMPGTTVAVDGVGQAQRATRTVAKTEDAAVVVTVTGSIHASDSYWIRCLPHDFPPLTVERPGQPSPGWYLLANAFNPPDPYAEFTMILDEHGTPVWYRRMPPSPFGAIDFKRLPAGQLAWIIPTGGAFGLDPSGSYEIRDLDGTVVHNVRTTLGPTDHHDLVVLPNGNYLAMTYVQRAIGATANCVDGNTPYTQFTATFAVDGVIEEITPAGATVWSWNSRDHFDPAESTLNLCFPGSGGQAHVLDPVHLNSIDVMPNGDIIASARHLDAIFRIDRATKKVVWKLGGTPTNHDNAQVLAFRNDPYGGFARQHDARVMANGDVSVFDNHTSFPFSPLTGAARASEYAIDTASGTATLVRSQVRSDGNYSGAMGSTQFLPDGGALAGWGALGPAFTEFAADGTPQYSVSLPGGHFTYRVVKEPPASFSVDVLRATAGR